MSNVRVRRSGLVSFAVKLSSLLTGLIFTVIVTSHLAPDEFGLWSLIGRTIGYTLLPTSILTFWTTRYRARGMWLGKTIVVGSAIFGGVLTVAFLAISLPVSSTVSCLDCHSSNIFYFILSSPQIALYTFAGSFEALLWATSPERNSIGFASFEVVKVAIGFYTIDILRLSLTGAVLTLVLAQAFQFLFTIYLTKNEYRDRVSLKVIIRMVRTGWLAILNNLHYLLRSFDFLVVAAFTGSANLLALYGAAMVIASATGYSSFLGQGLYPKVLGGGDPKTATKQIFELQLLFLCPMLLGAIFLRSQLLNLLNPSYVAAVEILIILVIGASFDSMQSLFEYTISASDTTDSAEKAELHAYLKGRLFLISKINLSLAISYLAALNVLGEIFRPYISSNFLLSNPVLLSFGLIWASVNAAISFSALVLKVYYSRKISPFSIDLALVRALILGSLIFGILMYFIGIQYNPPKGIVLQALYILGIGALGLGVYTTVIYALSKAVRALVKAIIQNIRLIGVEGDHR